jgi:nicotinamide-nucleotide amidase
MKITNVSSDNNQKYGSLNLASEVLKTINLLRDTGMTVGFAESCTGGLLSSEFTKVSGVSDVFVGSVVCYSNSVKENILGVKSETLKNFGAVSVESASELAIGVLKTLKANFAVSITGIAGPTGGSAQKPVGTVFISVAGADSVIRNYRHHFCDELSEVNLMKEVNREDIQKMACAAALEHLQQLIRETKN